MKRQKVKKVLIIISCIIIILGIIVSAMLSTAIENSVAIENEKTNPYGNFETLIEVIGHIYAVILPIVSIGISIFIDLVIWCIYGISIFIINKINKKKNEEIDEIQKGEQ